MERKAIDEWWMLAVPLELAVMARMGLHYPTVKELEANGWQDPRPLPDSAIVQEELAKLNAIRDSFTVRIPLPPDADLSNPPWSLFNAIDLDAHLADEFDADDNEPMDPLGATLTEDEQRERFAGYGRGGED